MAHTEAISSYHGGKLYRAVWRWHFYVGLFVIPFLLVLALSGMLMLLSKPLHNMGNQNLISIAPMGELLPASTLLAKVRQHYPDKRVQLYIQPKRTTDSAQFSLTTAKEHAGHNAPSITVYQNPYTGEILGTLDPATTLYARIKSFHGTLFLGDVGDSLIEIAAGLAVLMVLSGLYLAWPWCNRRLGKGSMSLGRREDWRQLHRVGGMTIALPLLFFLVSGLAWTNVWGGKLVQPWSSLPGTRFDAPKTEHTHQSMNQEGLHQVPWVMEQTPLPLATSGPGTFNLDAVIDIAKKQKFTDFRVHLPRSHTGVWTVSATTIAGDLTNPLTERTIHIDPANGKVLADIRFADYPLLGKAMAAFIPLHQGDLGVWNLLVNLLLTTLVVFMAISGVALWWKRRPAKLHYSKHLGLNPPTAPPGVSKSVIAVMAAVSLCFPLSAAALVVVIIIDWLVISRVEVLQVAVKGS